MDNCHVDANCINTEGDFQCQCKDGFMGSDISCTGTIVIFLEVVHELHNFFSSRNTPDEKMDTNLLLANMSQIYINLYLGKTDITFQYRSNNRLLDAIYQV